MALVSGGELSLNNKVNSIIDHSNEDQNLKLVMSNINSYLAKNIIVTAGKGIKQILKSEVDLSSVASPLIVTYPAVYSKGFVKVTPNNDKTINHLVHYVDNKPYSVIGGGQFANPNSEEELSKTITNLMDNARKTFKKFRGCENKQHYFGIKNEFKIGNKLRNYGHKIIRIDDNLVATIPGKFSLGFNLGIDTMKYFKLKTPYSNSIKNHEKEIFIGEILEEPNHLRVAKMFLK